MTTEAPMQRMPNESRADFRRRVRDDSRQTRYAKSGHADRVRPSPFVARLRTDADGGHLPKPFTAEELHERAVARRDRDMEMFKGLAMVGVTRHELGRIFDRRAPHANRSTGERKHFERKKSAGRGRVDYLVGLANNSVGLHANGKEPFPLRYLNRGERLREIARREAEVVNLPMAA